MEEGYLDINRLQQQLNDTLVRNLGMDIERRDDGFSLERLYQISGREDSVITISFRSGTSSYENWGDSVTCCLIYTERERIKLQAQIERGENTFGKAKARYLLFELPKEAVEKLEKEGFDSRDVSEVLIAPILNPENVYHGKELRQLNTINIPLDPEPPIDELKFELEALNHFRNDGMILTPGENNDYIALRLLFGVPLSEEENALVFDETQSIHNYDVARQFLFFKSRLHHLAKDKQIQQFQLERERLAGRLAILESRLLEMGYSLEKLKNGNIDVYNHIILKVSLFNEVRLNAVGKYPIFLDYEGYIHIGLRHVTEWQFCDYYAKRDKFQLREDDVLNTLRHIVDEINKDYQTIKEQRPEFLYRKFGKNSLYLNGDYYMIHIGKNGRIENFSKSVDNKFMAENKRVNEA